MPATMVHQVLNASIEPIEEAVCQSTQLNTEERVLDLVESAIHSANMLEGAWAGNLRVADEGIERKKFLYHVEDTAAAVERLLALMNKIHLLVGPTSSCLQASQSEQEALEKSINRLKAVRAQIAETIGWLKTPHRHIDPASVPTEGTGFKSLEETLTEL